MEDRSQGHPRAPYCRAGWSKVVVCAALVAAGAPFVWAAGPPETAVPEVVQVLPALGPKTPPAKETAPMPTALPAAYDPLHFARGAEPINLPAALRLAETANFNVLQAREVVARARAALLRAQVLFLPNLNLGSTYVDHEGQIQRAQGEVITANRNSLFVGGGPALSVAFTEAIFTPLAGRQLLVATQAGLRRVNNDVLLQVGDAYLAVLRARRRLARADETLDFLTSERPSPQRAGSRGLLPVVFAVYRAGGQEALRAEVERVRVEVLRRQEERTGAVNEFRVTAAELARLIRLDPTVPLWPIEDFRFPVPLPGEIYARKPVEELVAVALNNRPELAENQALVAAAVERVRTAKYRPLLPNLAVNYGYGGFGGGPDPNPPIVVPPARPGEPERVVAQPGWGPSGRIRHFKNRSDFDVTLVWRLQNLGLGNLAEIRETTAAARQASLVLLQMRDRVVTQVVQAYELVQGWRTRVETMRTALFDAKGAANGPVFQSLRLNFERIREVERTRPLEVLDSIRGLNDVLESYAQALTEYERAQLRLLVAMGLSPAALLEAAGCPPLEGQAAGGR